MNLFCGTTPTHRERRFKILHYESLISIDSINKVLGSTMQIDESYYLRNF